MRLEREAYLEDNGGRGTDGADPLVVLSLLLESSGQGSRVTKILLLVTAQNASYCAGKTSRKDNRIVGLLDGLTDERVCSLQREGTNHELDRTIINTTTVPLAIFTVFFASTEATVTSTAARRRTSIIATASNSSDPVAMGTNTLGIVLNNYWDAFGEWC